MLLRQVGAKERYRHRQRERVKSYLLVGICMYNYSVLQRAAACCRVLQHAAVCCSVLQCAAVCFSVCNNVYI